MKGYSHLFLAIILSARIGAAAQDVATDTAKVAKATGHATEKAADTTKDGTEKTVKGAAHATGHAAKKAAHGVKKGVEDTGKAIKHNGTGKSN